MRGDALLPPWGMQRGRLARPRLHADWRCRSESPCQTLVSTKVFIAENHGRGAAQPRQIKVRRCAPHDLIVAPAPQPALWRHANEAARKGAQQRGLDFLRHRPQMDQRHIAPLAGDRRQIQIVRPCQQPLLATIPRVAVFEGRRLGAGQHMERHTGQRVVQQRSHMAGATGHHARPLAQSLGRQRGVVGRAPQAGWPRAHIQRHMPDHEVVNRPGCH